MRNAIPSAVYVMRCGDLVKVGRSANPLARAKSLQTATAREVIVCHTTPTRSDASFVEAQAHRLLAEKREHGEWFRTTVDEAIAVVDVAIRKVETAAQIARCRRCRPVPVVFPRLEHVKAPGSKGPVVQGPRKQFTFRVDEEFLRAIGDLQRWHEGPTVPSMSAVIRMALFEQRDILRKQAGLD